MTSRTKYDLFQAWSNESFRDWRNVLDEESRAYLAELDLLAYEHRIQEARREFDGALGEIIASVDQNHVQNFRAHQAEYALADAVRELRRELLMDREDLARKTGLSEDEIKALECGTGKPTFATINLIANAIDFPIRMSFMRWSP